MLELIRAAATLASAIQGWYLDQSLPVQILAAAVALAVLWVAWTLLRLTLGALRGTFRGL